MALVSTDWLRKNIFNKNIKILDCSWHMPNTARIGKNEFETVHIPGSIFFDLDEFSMKGDIFPHTLLPDQQFSEMIGEIGITNNDHIIVYDSLGAFSSPRVWWMFHYYGHDQVSILDGGLPKWLKEKKEIETGKGKKYPKALFQSKENKLMTKNYEEIKNNIQNNNFQLIDARSAGRFLEKKSKTLKIDLSKPVVFSCGSGVTACIIGKAFNIVSEGSICIYDGSWTEWATKEQLFT